jgi:hypothetical protein
MSCQCDICEEERREIKVCRSKRALADADGWTLGIWVSGAIREGQVLTLSGTPATDGKWMVESVEESEELLRLRLVRVV